MTIARERDAEVVGLVLKNTLLGGAGGGITVLLFNRFKRGFRLRGKWNHTLTLNGTLIGIVAQCAGVNTYYCSESLFIGVLAGMVYIGASKLVLKLKLDDPLDAIAVHAGGGTCNNKQHVEALTILL